MKNSKKVLAIIICVYILFGLTACAGYKKISDSDAKSKIENGATVVDVRTQSEFEAEHLPKAIVIPYNEISNLAQSRLPNKNAVIILYCQSGRRSEIAARELISLGYSQVYDLGGIGNWTYGTVIL